MPILFKRGQCDWAKGTLVGGDGGGWISRKSDLRSIKDQML